MLFLLFGRGLSTGFGLVQARAIISFDFGSLGRQTC